MFPTARKDGLVVQEVGDEVIVYDQAQRRFHRLNRSSATIWRQCDGKTGILELAAFLPEQVEASAKESLVWLALDRLQQADLLREKLTIPPTAAGVSRRDALKNMAGGFALLVPVVACLVAPSPANAYPDTTCDCLGPPPMPPIPTPADRTTTTITTSVNASCGNPERPTTVCGGFLDLRCTNVSNWSYRRTRGGHFRWTVVSTQSGDATCRPPKF